MYVASVASASDMTSVHDWRNNREIEKLRNSLLTGDNDWGQETNLLAKHAEPNALQSYVNGSSDMLDSVKRILQEEENPSEPANTTSGKAERAMKRLRFDTDALPYLTRALGITDLAAERFIELMSGDVGFERMPRSKCEWREEAERVFQRCIDGSSLTRAIFAPQWLSFAQMDMAESAGVKERPELWHPLLARISKQYSKRTQHFAGGLYNRRRGPYSDPDTSSDGSEVTHDCRTARLGRRLLPIIRVRDPEEERRMELSDKFFASRLDLDYKMSQRIQREDWHRQDPSGLDENPPSDLDEKPPSDLDEKPTVDDEQTVFARVMDGSYFTDCEMSFIQPEEMYIPAMIEYIQATLPIIYHSSAENEQRERAFRRYRVLFERFGVRWSRACERVKSSQICDWCPEPPSLEEASEMRQTFERMHAQSMKQAEKEAQEEKNRYLETLLRWDEIWV